MTQIVPQSLAYHGLAAILCAVLTGCSEGARPAHKDLDPAPAPEQPAEAAVPNTAPERMVDAAHVSGPVGPPAANSPDWSAEPMAHWTTAFGLEAFHDTWTKFAVASAGTPPAGDTLVPYANATTYQGASWGLTTEFPVLVLFDEAGHAYRYSSGQHGDLSATKARSRAALESLNELGLDELRAGKTLHATYDGSTLNLLGALRASGTCGTCGTCHDNDRDKLLGVYHYTLSEIPDD